MVGSIDNVDCGTISGWALDPESPHVRLKIRVQLGEQWIATVDASIFRQDLLNAEKGDGKCGFVVSLSEAEWKLVLASPRTLKVAAYHPESGIQIPLSMASRVRTFVDGATKQSDFLKSNKTRNFQLSAVCIIKNEAHFVEEWIIYHLAIGVQFFLLFDNGSSDNLYSVLGPYIKRGIVNLISWPNFVVDATVRRSAWHEQNIAYIHALRYLEDSSDWVVILDVDEFLVTSGCNVADFLAKSPDKDVFTLYWRFFGSGGHKSRPNGLVIENFVFRAPDETRSNGSPFKFVIRPSAIGWLLNTHLPLMARDGAIGETTTGTRYWTRRGIANSATFSEIWVNHYHVKSQDDYKAKVSRGWPENTDNKNFDWPTFFNIHDRNEVADSSLAKFGDIVRHGIGMFQNTKTVAPEVVEYKNMMIIKLEIEPLKDRVKIYGFAIDLRSPGKRVTLKVTDLCAQLITELTCDHLVSSLRDQNLGDAHYGFNFSIDYATFFMDQVRFYFHDFMVCRNVICQDGNI